MSFARTYQHVGAYPADLLDFSRFETFLKNMESSMLRVVEAMLDTSSLGGKTHWKHAVETLNTFLVSAVGMSHKNDNLLWLSQAAIMDSRALFSSPFGDPLSKDVYPGFGSDEGSKAFRGKGSFVRGIEIMYDYMIHTASEDMLSVLFYVRKNEAEGKGQPPQNLLCAYWRCANLCPR